MKTLLIVSSLPLTKVAHLSSYCADCDAYTVIEIISN